MGEGGRDPHSDAAAPGESRLLLAFAGGLRRCAGRHARRPADHAAGVRVDARLWRDVADSRLEEAGRLLAIGERGERLAVEAGVDAVANAPDPGLDRRQLPAEGP